MNCPDCDGPTRCISTRWTEEIAKTRIHQCLHCKQKSYSVQIPVTSKDIYKVQFGHAHVLPERLKKILSAVYS